MILPDVVWHVFSVESGGYNKVKKKRRVGGVGWCVGCSLTSSFSIRLMSVACIGHVVFPNLHALQSDMVCYVWTGQG